MNNCSYEYIEDNGGGLHLFISQDNRVIAGLTNLEYAQPGEWQQVKSALDKDPLSEVSLWEGHISNPAEFYEKLFSYEFGYEVVCFNGTLYPDRMGGAAKEYFGVLSD